MVWLERFYKHHYTTTVLSIQNVYHIWEEIAGKKGACRSSPHLKPDLYAHFTIAVVEPNGRPQAAFVSRTSPSTRFSSREAHRDVGLDDLLSGPPLSKTGAWSSQFP